MKFLEILLFSFNIVLAFSEKTKTNVSEDCKKVDEFFSNYKKSTGSNVFIPVCCSTENKHRYFKCENDHITEMYILYFNFILYI